MPLKRLNLPPSLLSIEASACVYALTFCEEEPNGTEDAETERETPVRNCFPGERQQPYAPYASSLLLRSHLYRARQSASFSPSYISPSVSFHFAFRLSSSSSRVSIVCRFCLFLLFQLAVLCPVLFPFCIQFVSSLSPPATHIFVHERIKEVVWAAEKCVLDFNVWCD